MWNPAYYYALLMLLLMFVAGGIVYFIGLFLGCEPSRAGTGPDRARH